jgi:DNA-binding NarL/FixJ family response regulator
MKQERHLLIVAADPLARSALAASCENLPGWQVKGLVNPSTAEDHLADLEEESEIDLLIWDLGWEAAADATTEFQELEIPLLLLLSDAEQAQEAWSAGARAMVSREVSGEILEAALNAASCGLLVLDPALATSFLPSPLDLDHALEEELTPREMEVLQLLAEGMTNKAIAEQLQISRHTVKFHVNAILGKLNAQSRTEAVVRATRTGLLAL